MGAKGTTGLMLLAAVFTAAVFVLNLFGTVPAPVLPFLPAVPAGLSAWALYELYAAVGRSGRRSKKMGFDLVVLVPLYAWWAKILVRVSGGCVNERFSRAYEIHINRKCTGRLKPKEFARRLESELKKAEDRFPGALFVWESYVKPPGIYRKKIGLKEKEGRAFMRESRGVLLKLLSIAQPELLKKNPVYSGAYINKSREG